jgi:hypothetical protein
LTATGSGQAGVILDDAGRAWPPHPSSLARQLGWPTDDFDVIGHAVRRLGYVHVAPLRDALVVKFDPATVHHLAAIAAFYEIAGRAPKRLILACPGEPGSPDRYEIFHSISLGLRRLEAAAEACLNAAAPKEAVPVAGREGVDRGDETRQPRRKEGRAASSPRPRGLAVHQHIGESSKRLWLPLDAIPPQDAWLAQLLGLWRDARTGWRLPASESLDPLEALNIAQGRAHLVDTRDTDPSGYRFRLWGAANSLGTDRANQTLGQMLLPGLMREDAIEDYSGVVNTGVPTYQLIHHSANGLVYSYARLLLPLAADGRRVDQLLVLFHERLLPELEIP